MMETRRAKRDAAANQEIGTLTVLISAHDILRPVTLLVPFARYDPAKLEEGGLPLPLCALDQGLRLLLHPYVKKIMVTHFTMNSVPLVPTCLNYEGSWSRLLKTSNSSEKKITMVISRKGKLMGDKTDVTDHSRLVGVGFWKVSSDTLNMAYGNLKFPTEVDPAIMTGFGESSKVTQSATSARKMRAGKGVADEEPNSHLKMVIEKLKQVFSEEKCNKDTNAGMDYLIQLVIASLGELFESKARSLKISLLLSTSVKKLLKRLLCCLPELGISFFVQRFHWAVSKVKQQCTR
ncbi:hypothetical protein QYF36_006222 [Acer negundo]|nr:hypothetical protein QYF36_006222 [Acer negundo]